MRQTDFDSTHFPGVLLPPEEVYVGDLIFYNGGWCPVTMQTVVGDYVFVTFSDTSRFGGKPKTKEYRRSRRARVRRRLPTVASD